MKNLFILSVMAASMVVCVSCGITRATVRNSEKGASTTITITTNNPISTSVPVNVDAEVMNKPQ